MRKHVQTAFTVKMLSFDDKQKIILIKEVKNLLPDMNLVQVLSYQCFFNIRTMCNIVRNLSSFVS